MKILHLSEDFMFQGLVQSIKQLRVGGLQKLKQLQNGDFEIIDAMNGKSLGVAKRIPVPQEEPGDTPPWG
jgi:hypothetical protein